MATKNPETIEKKKKKKIKCNRGERERERGRAAEAGREVFLSTETSRV